MPAETKPTITITIWRDDHAEFVKLCEVGGWKQAGGFRALLEQFKRAETHDRRSVTGLFKSQPGQPSDET